MIFEESYISGGTEGDSVVNSTQDITYNLSEGDTGREETLIRKNQLEALLWRGAVTARLLICEVLVCDVKF